jgi:hypothetical protein
MVRIIKTLIMSLTLWTFLSGCRENGNSDNAIDQGELQVDSFASLEFPRLIKGGTKVVYQYGK